MLDSQAEVGISHEVQTPDALSELKQEVREAMKKEPLSEDKLKAGLKVMVDRLIEKEDDQVDAGDAGEALLVEWVASSQKNYHPDFVRDYETSKREGHPSRIPEGKEGEVKLSVVNDTTDAAWVRSAEVDRELLPAAREAGRIISKEAKSLESTRPYNRKPTFEKKVETVGRVLERISKMTEQAERSEVPADIEVRRIDVSNRMGGFERVNIQTDTVQMSPLDAAFVVGNIERGSGYNRLLNKLDDGVLHPWERDELVDGIVNTQKMVDESPYVDILTKANHQSALSRLVRFLPEASEGKEIA